MGLTKNYLRYVHETTFGVIATSQVGASIHFLQMRGTIDRFVAVPANETILFWDLKTKQIVNKLTYDTDNAAEVTVIDCHHGGHPRTNLIAVGYANGVIRLFEYETGLLKSVFTGHRTSISALKFDRDGSRLASGGKDSNIVLWDIVAEKGLFSLKGHKNSISKLQFLSNEHYQKDIIVSSSVDAVSTVKFWDLQTQHCFCTLPGQANGVWSFAIIKNGTRLITGTSSPELRVYSIEFISDLERDKLTEDMGPEPIDEDVITSESEYGMKVKHLGNILRNSTSTSSRIQDIVVDSSENFIICHSTDKNIELYGIRSEGDALKYAKKLAKKESRRLAKRKRESQDVDTTGCEDDDSIMIKHDQINSLNSLDNQTRVNCEFNTKFGCYKLSDKIKAISIANRYGKDTENKMKFSVMSSTNKIDTYIVDPYSEDKEKVFDHKESIESQSHRTDARAVAISPDCSLIMSASAESVKIWRTETRNCTLTIETQLTTCCVFANAEHFGDHYRNRFALLGTKQGAIHIVNFSTAEVESTYAISNDGKPITSICVIPDKTGVVVGCDDGIVRFFNYVWLTKDVGDGQNKTTLTIKEDRILQFQEGITNVKVSSNNNLLAVALLDSTVRVHFIDTFKYFLTMYGHKFPVTTMDISDDNTLLITGSPDKNIKIWGLDFGDCHKSIFAHEDAITCVKFVPKTHYVFSCGRDRTIKQWDCDHFIKIQTLSRHQGEVWCLDVSSNGKLVVTSSHDRSLRMHRKTEEILVPSEEEETERELQDERNVYEKQENIIVGEVNLEAGFASKMTIDTVKSADTLIEAIDIFDNERQKELDFKKQCEIANMKGEQRPPEPERDPLLMTAMTNDYNRFILEILRRIKSSELEEVFLTLPFDYVRRLLAISVILLEKGWDVELLTRCVSFLLRVNFGQIAACPGLVPVISKLKTIIKDRTNHLRDCAGFNMIALEHLKENMKYLDTRTSSTKHSQQQPLMNIQP